jgi:hypothetical protein
MICCHFKTQNIQTDLKTNDEGNTFLLCVFVLSEHKHHGLEVGCTSGDYERVLSAFIMNR